VNVVPDTNVMAMSNDVAILEAEHFANSIARNGATWAVDAAQAGFSGDGYVVANGGVPSATGEHLPNTFRTAAPELQYVVWFDTPGTYVVHARGIATDTAAGGINVGLDNEESRLADHVSPFSTSDWQWRHETREWDSQFDLLARNLTVLNVAEAGPHIINVWPRRSGVMLDRLMIARETRSQVSFKLTDPGDGIGPAESQRRRAPR
jgi:hypothetical protein